MKSIKQRKDLSIKDRLDLYKSKIIIKYSYSCFKQILVIIK
jgi:hypothetical protein